MARKRTRTQAVEDTEEPREDERPRGQIVDKTDDYEKRQDAERQEAELQAAADGVQEPGRRASPGTNVPEAHGTPPARQEPKADILNGPYRAEGVGVFDRDGNRVAIAGYDANRASSGPVLAEHIAKALNRRR